MHLQLGALPITRTPNSLPSFLPACLLGRYRSLDDGCDRARHADLLRQEAASGTHFFMGSGATFAQDESQLSTSLTANTYPANATLGRLMYQCCLGPDSIYEQVVQTDIHPIPPVGLRGQPLAAFAESP